jgi:urocanate hydratase
VAEKPEALVVYGGIGRAARDWESFDRIVARSAPGGDETLLVQSGKPVGVFRTHADAPRVLIANSNLVPGWATWDHFNELDRKGLMMYGQMTAGSWIYIGTQGIVQGTYETFARSGRRTTAATSRPLDPHGGLGRHGRRAAARRHHGGRLDAGVECQPSRIEMRLRTRYLDTQATSLDEALAIIERACRERQARLGRLLGNAARSSRARAPRRQARRGHRPDLRPRPAQRLPARGLDLREWEERRERDPKGTVEAAKRSMAPGRGHARLSGARACRRSTTATTSARWRRTWACRTPSLPGFVPAYIRPLFCRGIGPVPLGALSGDPGGHRRTDAKVKELIPDDPHLHTWLDMARSASPSRACPRASAGWAWVSAIGSASPSTRWWLGELEAPVVIGRDHLESGSVASPNRETEAMLGRLGRGVGLAAPQRAPQLRLGGHLGVPAPCGDGLLPTCREWSSWRTARPRPARRPRAGAVERSRHRVMRHADAGYEEAAACAREQG